MGRHPAGCGRTRPGKQGVAVTQALSQRLSNGRRFLPLATTIVMFGLVYAFGVLSFPAMRTASAFFNLLNTTPFLLSPWSARPRHHLRGIDLSVVASSPSPPWSPRLCSEPTGIP